MAHQEHPIHKTTTSSDSDFSPLNRQYTVNLTPDQYERLFFQPSAAKGDLAKRLGNPTLLGLLGFLVPFSSTMFCLLEFKGSNANSLPALTAIWYFYGGMCMVLAGLAEFILGNTFPFVVFTVYGVHWVASGYNQDPWHPLTAAFGASPENAVSMEYNSGQAMYFIVMTLVSFIFLLGSLRTNVPFVIVFVCLVCLFGLFAAGQVNIGYNPTAAGLAHTAYLFKIAGGFGFVAALMGWYLAIITSCASTGVPCPLPVFDLSTKLFKGSNAATNEHAGSVREEVKA